MRPGTLIQLKPENIDLRRSAMFIPSVKGQPGHEIPIVPPIRQFLEAWLRDGGKWSHKAD